MFNNIRGIVELLFQNKCQTIFSDISFLIKNVILEILQLWPISKEIIQHFGKYSYLLSWCELDMKVDTTL